MKKINIKEQQPELNERCLVYGTYEGEIHGLDRDKDWYFVYYNGNYSGGGIGGDCYSWCVIDIEEWIKIDL